MANRTATRRDRRKTTATIAQDLELGANELEQQAARLKAEAKAARQAARALNQRRPPRPPRRT